MPTYVPQTWTNGSGGPISAARLNYMEAGIADAGGGGGGTLVVYASDALDSNGDYVCDGTADEVTILAAYNALLASTYQAGTLILSEGTFNFSGPLVIPNGPPSKEIRIIGQSNSSYYGAGGGTNIVLASGAGPVIDARTSSPYNFHIEHTTLYNNSTTAGNVINIDDGVSLYINQCTLQSNSAAAHRGIESTGTYTEGEISDCFIMTSGAAIYVPSGYFFTIRDNYVWTSGVTDYVIMIIGGLGQDIYNESFMTITNNRSDGSNTGTLKLSGVAAVKVENNQFWYDDGVAVLVEDCAGIVLTGNNIGDGQADAAGAAIRIDNSPSCQVNNNFIFSPYEGHGIDLLDTKGCVVTGNLILDVGAGATTTYNGIMIQGNSDENLVYGNKVGTDSVSGNVATAQWGIRVDAATCNDNIVYGNDLKGSYVTAGFSDAGTGTITTSGNRT